MDKKCEQRLDAANQYHGSLNSVELKGEECHGWPYSSSTNLEQPYTHKHLVERTSKRINELRGFLEEIKIRKNDVGLMKLVQDTIDLNTLLLKTLQKNNKTS